jgi:hypothetical protein
MQVFQSVIGKYLPELRLGRPQFIPSAVRHTLGSATLLVCLLAGGLAMPAAAQSQQPSKRQGSKAATTPKTAPAAAQPPSGDSGKIVGTVIDKEGALAVGAKVKLTGDNITTPQEINSGDNGEFSFSNVPPGPFQLSITAPGFDPQQFSGELSKGQAMLVPPIVLSVSAAVTQVNVNVDPVQAAEIEVHEELQQRVLGFIPNFYVTYGRDPAPLFAKQKFHLATRSVIDPITILGVAFLAGIYQAADIPGGYGQGAEGYGKRVGAAYGDVLVGTYLGSAILPSLLHQDPRYFYQGTGTTKSRLAHALENAVIARNDRTKKWETNYSGILGSLAAGAVSYAYTPPRDRSVGIYLTDSLVRLGESSVAGVLQEFVLRKFTSNAPKFVDTPKSSSQSQP